MTHGTFKYVALLILSSCVITPLAYAQTTLYVDDDAGEGNIGQSWDAPYENLESALVFAREHPIITEIHVAGGVYVPSGESESGVPRSKTFQLVNGVAILGGYAGLADPGDPDVRDLNLYESILSGDLAGDDEPVSCPAGSSDCRAFGGFCVDGFCTIRANNTDNAYHVVTGSDTDATAVLACFTITAGNANGSNPHDHGGGIHIMQLTGSPTIEFCTIVRNRADFGGGVSCEPNSAAAFVHCTISENSAGQYGGAMFIALASNPTLTDCSIAHNIAPYEGGGVYCGDSSNPIIETSTITGNIAGWSGGGVYSSASTPTITDCRITQNNARDGGGMSLAYGSYTGMTDCLVAGNSATYHGGGIHFVSGGSANITSCRISGNRTSTFSGGGIYCTGSQDLELVNCVLSGNTVDGPNGGGGGMYFSESNLILTNCSFAGNLAVNGRALACDYVGHPSSLQLRNCILWDGGDEIWNNDGSTITITYSDVQDGWRGAGGNNIVAHPRFVRFPDDGGDGWGVGDNDDYGDLRLQSASPAIDAGSNAAVPLDIIVDLAGDLRFVDAVDTPDMGQGVSPLVDMGAYEFQFAAAGDIDGDGDVDLSDFRMFMESFGGPL